MHIQKQFTWDGKIATLLKNLSEADIAFSFNVKYKGQKQGREMPVDGKATELDMYNDSGMHVVPVESILYRDDRATWHIKDVDASLINTYLNKYNDSNIHKINSSGYMYCFEINTEWLNEVHDAITVYLVKKHSASPWILTDDGSTHYECAYTGLLDYNESDSILKAWKNRMKDLRTYFIHSLIKFNNESKILTLEVPNLESLDNRLHQFLQMIIEAISSASFAQEMRKFH